MVHLWEYWINQYDSNGINDAINEYKDGTEELLQTFRKFLKSEIHYQLYKSLSYAIHIFVIYSHVHLYKFYWTLKLTVR